MRRTLGAVLIFALKMACDVIRLVPTCDAECMRGRLLASYYSSPAGVNLLQTAAKNAPAKNLVGGKVTVVGLSSRSASKPPAPRTPGGGQITVTATVVKTVPMEIPRSVQPPVVVLQPRYLVQPMPIPVNAMSVATVPKRNAKPLPARHVVEEKPHGENEMINRIGRKVNLIYTMLSTLGQRYLQMPPQTPRVVLVAPVSTRTVFKTVSSPAPARSSAPASTQSASVITLTKCIFLPPQTEKKPQAQTSSTSTSTSPVSSAKETLGGNKTVGPRRIPKKPRNIDFGESSSSESSMSEQREEKPLYMLKSTGPGRKKRRRGDPFIDCYLKGDPSTRCTSDSSEGRPDIGDAVIYRSDLDSGDEIIYLSELLQG
ncbi:uncharacterized protein Eint_081910 [Encephalitozoon intestinalis ATCC 50506]|uniref:Uncharacterized protein n=2 Tax=Encephalitozoon intestinalis (strain ATCC 50506) TaxID=876142 RepID=E0S8B5_ENCIT|nr:uncharacterized protein Eint_081910 [Encephalitozoon intestinalis ATCC 50506]ADM12121.1 hypothetical protein Eint_081910 [Encephalitozoon intestinalis ATCC 50506]UTX45916.1 hypothetical protein GPK93_08g14970 [Encephalitozoon intestinalis]UTX46165.1 hypothetical protein GPK93_10g17590 [Encephalitozoon intestinalis]